MQKDRKRLALLLAAFLSLLAVGFIVAQYPAELEKAPLTLEQELDLQSANNGLYVPGQKNLAPYRLALAGRLHPKIAAIGSARLLQFRQEDFNVPFANLSGMTTLDEVSRESHALFSAHAPDIVLLGADFWWFGGFSAPNSRPSVCDGIPCAGTSEDGYDAAGAYAANSLWRGKSDTADKSFDAMLADIREQRGHFAAAAAPAEQDMKAFLDLLDYYHALNIKVLLFLPPLAPSVQAAMDDSGQYDYVDTLADALEAAAADRGFGFYDYRHSLAGSTDCEFSSGAEGGAIIAKRMLLAMATHDRDLRTRLKLPELGWDIQHYTGHASKRADEVDFLGLHCPKNPASPAP
ncbi:MAG: hypothetical protein PW788_14960 [Micavibrio sp.]|nr:hypothetical protein [Micavibrio sp.]